MAIFKPVVKEFTEQNSKFSGICKFNMINFVDKSGLFDWADIFIEIEVMQEHSDYSRRLQIKGSFDKEDDKIVGGSVLRRLYTFFEAIDCTAGINVNGGWENEKGEAIEDIAEYLTKNHLAKGDIDSFPDSIKPDDYPYIAYFYREQPKKPGAKSYTTVWPKVYKDSAENEVKLQKDIDWLKGKGYVKELTDKTANAPAMNSNSLSNL